MRILFFLHYKLSTFLHYKLSTFYHTATFTTMAAMARRGGIFLDSDSDSDSDDKDVDMLPVQHKEMLPVQPARRSRNSPARAVMLDDSDDDSDDDSSSVAVVGGGVAVYFEEEGDEQTPEQREAGYKKEIDELEANIKPISKAYEEAKSAFTEGKQLVAATKLKVALERLADNKELFYEHIRGEMDEKIAQTLNVQYSRGTGKYKLLDTEHKTLLTAAEKFINAVAKLVEKKKKEYAELLTIDELEANIKPISEACKKAKSATAGGKQLVAATKLKVALERLAEKKELFYEHVRGEMDEKIAQTLIVQYSRETGKYKLLDTEHKTLLTAAEKFINAVAKLVEKKKKEHAEIEKSIQPAKEGDAAAATGISSSQAKKDKEFIAPEKDYSAGGFVLRDNTSQKKKNAILQKEKERETNLAIARRVLRQDVRGLSLPKWPGDEIVKDEDGNYKVRTGEDVHPWPLAEIISPKEKPVFSFDMTYGPALKSYRLKHIAIRDEEELQSIFKGTVEQAKDRRKEALDKFFAMVKHVKRKQFGIKITNAKNELEFPGFTYDKYRFQTKRRAGSAKAPTFLESTKNYLMEKNKRVLHAFRRQVDLLQYTGLVRPIKNVIRKVLGVLQRTHDAINQALQKEYDDAMSERVTADDGAMSERVTAMSDDGLTVFDLSLEEIDRAIAAKKKASEKSKKSKKQKRPDQFLTGRKFAKAQKDKRAVDSDDEAAAAYNAIETTFFDISDEDFVSSDEDETLETFFDRSDEDEGSSDEDEGSSAQPLAKRRKTRKLKAVAKPSAKPIASAKGRIKRNMVKNTKKQHQLLF